MRWENLSEQKDVISMRRTVPRKAVLSHLSRLSQALLYTRKQAGLVKQVRRHAAGSRTVEVCLGQPTLAEDNAGITESFEVTLPRLVRWSHLAQHIFDEQCVPRRYQESATS